MGKCWRYRIQSPCGRSQNESLVLVTFEPVVASSVVDIVCGMLYDILCKFIDKLIECLDLDGLDRK
jgi:hypothetical protein